MPHKMKSKVVKKNNSNANVSSTTTTTKTTTTGTATSSKTPIITNNNNNANNNNNVNENNSNTNDFNNNTTTNNNSNNSEDHVIGLFYQHFDANGNERNTMDTLPGYKFPPPTNVEEKERTYCEIVLRRRFEGDPVNKNTDVYWYFSYGNIVYKFRSRIEILNHYKEKKIPLK